MTTSNNGAKNPRQPFVLWLTGLPASGKSTLGNLMVEDFLARGLRVELLDSDALRDVLSPDPSYTAAERDWFYSVLVYIGRLLTRNEVNVVYAATAHLQVYRQRAREAFENFSEIYLDCPLDVCKERDTKGIYRKALSGEAKTVPGVQVLYEAPQVAEIKLDTWRKTPQECQELVLTQIEAFGYI